MDSEYYDRHIWDVISSQYKELDGRELIRHLLESYDDLITTKIDHIVEGFNVIEVPYKYNASKEVFEYRLFVKICNVKMSRPIIYEKDGGTSVMTPHIARVRNLTYSSNLYGDVYVSGIWYDDKWEMKEGKKILKNVNLGKMPVMVHSSYCVLKNPEFSREEVNCRYDYGGYFIVNGNEKVVVCQDRISENKIYVFMDSKLSNYSHIAEIRSVIDNVFGAPKLTSIKLSSKQNQMGRSIRVSIHHVRNDIPLVILMRALGVESDYDIVRHIVMGRGDIDSEDDDKSKKIAEMLVGSISEGCGIMTQIQALEWISQYLNMSGVPKEQSMNNEFRIKTVKDILTKDFLPHVGTDSTKMLNKAIFVGFMVNKLLMCFNGYLPLDDRDSYMNKRVDTPGILLANLYRQYFGKMVKDMKGQIYKEMTSGSWRSTNDFMNTINLSNIYKIIKFTTIESGLKYALSTGNWGLKNSNVKQGVAQVLNRLTYKANLSHLRRINTPMEKSGKLIQPRKLHPTQWGIICPSETPEGSSVGLVKNLSIGATITVATQSYSVWYFVEKFGTKMDIVPEDVYKNTVVMINGSIAGVHTDPSELFQKMKCLKRRGIISIYASVSWDIQSKTISISTEAGRCIRPLLVVDNGCKIRLREDDVRRLNDGEIDWNYLISPSLYDKGSDEDNSVIEYLDVDEMNTSIIAMRISDLERGSKGSLNEIQYQYMEIHPSLILGVTANDIPFPQHNQAPRVTYQSAMGKQAIGIYATNYEHRLDTISHILNYPQRSLIHTSASDRILHYNDLPAGNNVIVAIASYTGFNQEDSIIVNQSAIDRGMFMSTCYYTVKDHCMKNHSTGEEELYMRPNVETESTKGVIKNLKPFNYDKLNENGFVSENTYVSNGDILIGKCMPHKTDDVIINKDNSHVIKGNQSGYVDKCCANDQYFKNTNADGYTFAKIRIRSMRSPIIGDKLSSRYAQKGTIGMVYPMEDMPFSDTGIVPDIIVNPHAIPSRMTIGQLMECIMGKVCCSMGCYGDGTAFTGLSVDDISNALVEKCGLEPYGNEIMYNGHTGEQMATSIFIGPTYYQRLKHMVYDKLHSRSSSGPIVLLTRQPSEGRARDGGLRLGEMEVECIWAHGSMHYLKERLMECSDNYRLFICKKCGIGANVNPESGIYKCHTCTNTSDFHEIRIPYAFKLLVQEVQTMGIGTRFISNSLDAFKAEHKILDECNGECGKCG
jgi:DNA-directed RNA polymerase II subunit RPB2